MGRKPNNLLRRRDIEFKLSFEEMRWLLRKLQQYEASSMEGRISHVMLRSFRIHCEKLYRQHHQDMPDIEKLVMEDAIDFFDEHTEDVDKELEMMEELKHKKFNDERAIADALNSLPSTEFGRKPNDHWMEKNEEVRKKKAQTE